MAQEQGSGAAVGAADVLGAAAYYAQIDELYKHRDDAGVPAKLEQALAAASKALPEDAGVLWRSARWQFWRADTSESDKAKENMAKIGWDLAERALKKEPNSIDARYWAAANTGTYGDAIGVLNALSKGIEGKFRTNLDYTVEKQPSYEWGGPLLTLGRYYSKLPWPKRDKKKAVSNLRAALKLSPTNLRARVYLAEVLMTEGDDEKKEALKLVDEVLAAKPGAYDAPEERHMQKLAGALKPKIEEELK